MKPSKEFKKFIHQISGEKFADKDDIAVIYLYEGNKDKFIDEVRSIFDNYKLPSTRFEIEKKEYSQFFLNNLAGAQIGRAALLDIARHKPELARQFYEWALENTYLSEDYLADCNKTKYYGEAAQGFVWHGYTQLAMGRYSDANDSLKNVTNLFMKQKGSGGIYQDIEYALSKALLPLCEYKLNPSDANRIRARKGIEDFIDGVTRNGSKLQCLLYYYHLKDKFPELYGGDDTSSAAQVKNMKLADFYLSVNDIDNRGAVVIYDPNGYLNIFGKPRELLTYIHAVNGLGSYPLLSGLLDYYNLEDNPGMNPRELAGECERLLSATDDVWLREKTEALLDVAREADEEGSTVVLYQDPDIDTG